MNTKDKVEQLAIKVNHHVTTFKSIVSTIGRLTSMQREQKKRLSVLEDELVEVILNFECEDEMERITTLLEKQQQEIEILNKKLDELK